MTRFTFALSLSCLTALTAVGCGGNKIDQVYDKQESILRELCECEELLAMSGTTREACIAEIEGELPTETERECTRAVYDRNASALDGPSDCFLDAANDYESCINSASCNIVALRTCQESFSATVDRCPEPPDSVDAEFAACFPE